MNTTYVHGYTGREHQRLHDQAATLSELFHCDTSYPAGSRVLEAGCGVGAQTAILAHNSPGAEILSIDISDESLAAARARIEQKGLTGVRFQRADIFSLPFADGEFDHVFACFVLEHLSDPDAALASLRRVLRPGGTITVIECDHSSTLFHPYSEHAHHAIDCLVQAQARLGGDPRIGRRLYPLLARAGFASIRVSPRVAYADGGKPEMAEGFTVNTFTAMVEGARDQAFRMGLTDPDRWTRGIRDLYRTAEPDGTFVHTFFKAVGLQPSC